MQDRKRPPKKLGERERVWFGRGWLWNVEAGLPEILTAGPWNQVMPNFRNKFSRRGPWTGEGQTLKQPGLPVEPELSGAQVWNLMLAWLSFYCDPASRLPTALPDLTPLDG